jgi:hypothetical protein
MKYFFLLMISINAFTQHTRSVPITASKVYINGQSNEGGALKFTREQLKEAVVSLDPTANLPEKTRVACFEVAFPQKPYVVVSGNKLNIFVEYKLSKLKTGDTIVISDIKYTNPGDKTWHKYTGSQKIMIVE